MSRYDMRLRADALAARPFFIHRRRRGFKRMRAARDERERDPMPRVVYHITTVYLYYKNVIMCGAICSTKILVCLNIKCFAN